MESWVQQVNSLVKVFRNAIISSSSKVEQSRGHENTTIKYVTVHSWARREFEEACVKDGVATAIYNQIASSFYEDFI